jgi:uncharacterized protein (DUF58 family)
MILWFVICLVALVSTWPHIWFRMVRDKVEVNVVAEKVQVEQGKEIPVRVTLRNRSWLPCPYVELTLDLSPGLTARADKAERTLRWKTYAFMRQEVTATLVCYATRRGLHELGHRPVVLRMNEGFGLRDLFLSREFRQDIVVFPKLRPLLDVRAEMDALVGDVEVRRWLHPDEAMLRGIRPWQPGDSHRHIAWLASARSGEWMTKEFSTTTDLQACLLLNAQFYEIPWLGSDVERFDELCSVTRAVAYALGRRKVPIVFASNATSPGQPRRRWHGEQTPAGIKVLLGHFHPLPNCDFAHVLASVPEKVQASTPLIVIAHYLSQQHIHLLRQHVRRGRRVHVVWSGDEAGLRRLRDMGAGVVPVGLEIDRREVATDGERAGSAS